MKKKYTLLLGAAGAFVFASVSSASTWFVTERSEGVNFGKSINFEKICNPSKFNLTAELSHASCESCQSQEGTVYACTCDEGYEMNHLGGLCEPTDASGYPLDEKNINHKAGTSECIKSGEDMKCRYISCNDGWMLKNNNCEPNVCDKNEFPLEVVPNVNCTEPRTCKSGENNSFGCKECAQGYQLVNHSKCVKTCAANEALNDDGQCVSVCHEEEARAAGYNFSEAPKEVWLAGGDLTRMCTQHQGGCPLYKCTQVQIAFEHVGVKYVDCTNSVNKDICIWSTTHKYEAHAGAAQYCKAKGGDWHFANPTELSQFSSLITEKWKQWYPKNYNSNGEGEFNDNYWASMITNSNYGDGNTGGAHITGGGLSGLGDMSHICPKNNNGTDTGCSKQQREIAYFTCISIENATPDSGNANTRAKTTETTASTEVSAKSCLCKTTKAPICHEGDRLLTKTDDCGKTCQVCGSYGYMTFIQVYGNSYCTDSGEINKYRPDVDQSVWCFNFEYHYCRPEGGVVVCGFWDRYTDRKSRFCGYSKTGCENKVKKENDWIQHILDTGISIFDDDLYYY